MALQEFKPQILIEEFVDDGGKGSPIDYKLFVFDGAEEFIQVDLNRFTAHRRRLYTPSWQQLEVLYGYDDIIADVPAPIHLDEMIDAAEKLGRDLDFIRADFYDTPRRTYFGELTTTPECAMEIFDPIDFDRYLGSKWSCRLSGRCGAAKYPDLRFVCSSFSLVRWSLRPLKAGVPGMRRGASVLPSKSIAAMA